MDVTGKKAAGYILIDAVKSLVKQVRDKKKGRGNARPFCVKDAFDIFALWPSRRECGVGPC